VAGPDELEGWALCDVKAFALDPEVRLRRLAALSRMTIDRDLQRTLAADPDERVVLAMLARVDPSIEANLLIIQGPHVEARRVLAERNLTTPSLLLLAFDDDHQARTSARHRLEARGVELPVCVNVQSPASSSA
jgi:hypothetical protein